MKGRRVILGVLLFLAVFHASLSPVLASNIGSEEFLKTYDPEKTYEIKPILLPPSESNTTKSQTHERNPNGSVVGSPYANIPDSELSTEELAAKYGTTVGQIPQQSVISKIGNFFSTVWNDVKEFFGFGKKSSASETQTNVTGKVDSSKKTSQKTTQSSGFFAGIKKTVSNAWTSTKSTISSVSRSITGSVSQFQKSIFEKASDTWHSFTNTLIRPVNYVKKQADNVDIWWNGSHEERKLMREIEDKFHIKVKNSIGNNWSIHELEMTKEILNKLPKDFYNQNVLTTMVRQGTYKDATFPCTNFGILSKKSIAGLYSSYCKTLSIYDTAVDSIAKEYGKISHDDTFKLTMAHELTHAYQFAHKNKVEEFNSFDWVDPPHYYDNDPQVISDTATNCDFATTYMTGTIEEMAEIYAVKIVKPELFKQKYYEVRNMKTSIKTYPVHYDLKPCPTKKTKEGEKEIETSVPFEETILYKKVHFNY